MRTIISDYISKTVFRRGFIKNMVSSGFSRASVNSVLGSLGSLREENSLGEVEYRSIAEEKMTFPKATMADYDIYLF